MATAVTIGDPSALQASIRRRIEKTWELLLRSNEVMDRAAVLLAELAHESARLSARTVRLRGKHRHRSGRRGPRGPHRSPRSSTNADAKRR